MQKKLNKNIDYVFLNTINHLIRKDEKVLSVIDTKTLSPELKSRSKYANYKLVATDTRIIILSKSEKIEHSESFGYNELKETTLTRGLFRDKLKLYRSNFKLTKKNSRKFLKLADKLQIKISLWKYYVLTFAMIIILAATYKLADYIIQRGYLFEVKPASEKKEKIKVEQKKPKKKKPTKVEIDRNLADILKGYKFAYKRILKNYPVYYKKPVMSGDPASAFDTWAGREVLNYIDAQDDKLSSYNLTLEKHVMFKLELSKLRLSLMRYLDLCKKTFKKAKLRKKLSRNRKVINAGIKKLEKIIE